MNKNFITRIKKIDHRERINQLTYDGYLKSLDEIDDNYGDIVHNPIANNTVQETVNIKCLKLSGKVLTHHTESCSNHYLSLFV
jgi:hypothetical protein